MWLYLLVEFILKRDERFSLSQFEITKTQIAKLIGFKSKVFEWKFYQNNQTQSVHSGFMFCVLLTPRR